MGKRRMARERAVQFLFQYDVNPSQYLDDALDQFWITHRQAMVEGEKDKARYGEPIILPPITATETATRAFADSLVKGVLKNREAVDAHITKHSQNWDLHRMSVVDRNVLRLAIYEMFFCEEIPPVVSINEAVDIAKKYSTEESGKFVNGILDKVRGDLLRPSR